MVQRDNKIDEDSDDGESPEAGCTLFVKNLNFSTTEETLKQVSCASFLPLFYDFDDNSLFVWKLP